VTTCDSKTVDSEVNGWIFGNILFGGLIGVVVDLVQGYSNEPVDKVSVVNCDTDITVAKAD